MSLPLIVNLLIIDLYYPSEWYSLSNINDLYMHLLDDFEEIQFGDFVMKNEKNYIISNVRAILINNNEVSIYKENSQYKQISDCINIKYKDIYFASSSKKNSLPRPIEYQPRTRCTLYFTFEISLDEMTNSYDDEFGKLILIHDNILECNITNNEIYNEFIKTKPSFIKNGILYSLSSWEYIERLIYNKFSALQPKKFMIFLYLEQLFSIYPMENSLWDELLVQFGLGNNIHYLNSNFSTFFYCMEGSLEIVDIYLNLKKKNNIL
jgi:hypothetical protein